MEKKENKQSSLNPRRYSGMGDIVAGAIIAPIIWLIAQLFLLLIMPWIGSMLNMGSFAINIIIFLGGPIVIFFFIRFALLSGRKFMAIGAILAAIIPFLITGSCIIGLGR